MPCVRRFVRRQNARFAEETIFFSEEDPYKAAQFLFNQKKKVAESENRRCTPGLTPALHMETFKTETA